MSFIKHCFQILYHLIFYLLTTCIFFIYCFYGLKYFLYYSNNHLETTTYTIHSSKIPESFSGYRIVQLSDLHSKYFGQAQEQLLEKVQALHPDIIVFTGDLIDGNTKLEEPCTILMKGLVKIAPTYYIYGNHEANTLNLEAKQAFYKELDQLGVITLYGTGIKLTNKYSETINLLGIPDPIALKVHDPLFKISNQEERVKSLLTTTLSNFPLDQNYTILLSHRPEYFSIYTEFPIDLVLCGHTHGGQIRVPILGGIFSSSQGFFPDYDSGCFKQGELTMLVNRGLGSSSFPYRVFNQPEIGLIILEQ